MEGVIGYVTLFAGNFSPRNWAFCQGQTINIASNTALFSILGTTYGGNGQTTFLLPDLRGRVVVGAGQGPGLSYYALGQSSGQESVTMLGGNLPLHTHPMSVNAKMPAHSLAAATSPVNAEFGPDDTGAAAPYTQNPPNALLQAYPAQLTTTPTGNSTPFSIIHPVLGLNYVICMYGIYPQRS
jgi:microcystin-dependent protein